MSEAKKDARSVTGSNIRNIIILFGKTHDDDLKFEYSNITTHHELETNDCFFLSFVY